MEDRGHHDSASTGRTCGATRSTFCCPDAAYLLTVAQSFTAISGPPPVQGSREGNDVPIFLDMRGQISITTGGSSQESSVDRLSQGLRSGINRWLQSSSALYSWAKKNKKKRAIQASRSGCSQQGVSPDHCVGLHSDF